MDGDLEVLSGATIVASGLSAAGAGLWHGASCGVSVYVLCPLVSALLLAYVLSAGGFWGCVGRSAAAGCWSIC